MKTIINSTVKYILTTMFSMNTEAHFNKSYGYLMLDWPETKSNEMTTALALWRMATSVGGGETYHLWVTDYVSPNLFKVMDFHN